MQPLQQTTTDTPSGSQKFEWFPCVLCAFRHISPAAQVSKEVYRKQPSGEPFWTGKEVEPQIQVVPQIVECKVFSGAPENVRGAAANAGSMDLTTS